MKDEPRPTPRATAGPYRASRSRVAAWWARWRRPSGHRQDVLGRGSFPDLGPFVCAYSTDLAEPLDGQRVTVGGRVAGAVSAVLSGVGQRVLWSVDDGHGHFHMVVPVGFPSGVALGWAVGKDVIAIGRVASPDLLAERVWTLDEVRAMGPRAFAQLIAAELFVIPEPA